LQVRREGRATLGQSTDLIGHGILAIADPRGRYGAVRCGAVRRGDR
jgi:hypothetical protein